MKIWDIEEHGFERAMVGLARSYKQPVHKMPAVALRLSPLDKGHNKFLRFIQVWMEIQAPRYWWQEFDTYTVGVVRQSEATMHGALDHGLTQDDFEYPVYQATINDLNHMIKNRDPIEKIKNRLPEGYLQARSVNTNYAAIRNILIQRHLHKLPQWKEFCEAMTYLKYYDYLGLNNGNK